MLRALIPFFILRNIKILRLWISFAEGYSLKINQ